MSKGTTTPVVHRERIVTPIVPMDTTPERNARPTSIELAMPVSGGGTSRLFILKKLRGPLENSIVKVHYLAYKDVPLDVPV